ncbi:MAG: tRNA (adenosine(37)-N6)-dimethylallyltransferase MiaA [Candidatus Gracilibacteria bacterium]
MNKLSTQLLDKWIGGITDLPGAIIIFGPTACGKTALSLEIAQYMRSKVISADSRQIYRGLDIGTGKILPNQMRGVSHEMLNVIDIDQVFSAGDFAQRSLQIIARENQIGSIPVIVGGTGLYIDMLLYGASTHSWKADPDYRDSLQKILDQEGSEVLYEKLTQIDPASAATLDHRNTRYVMSALEYFYATGQSKSGAYIPERVARLDTFFITPYQDNPENRKQLYIKIDQRVNEMFDTGLLEEYDAMVEKFGSDAPGLNTIGYKECGMFRRGEIASYSELIDLVAQKNRNYAKRQITWNKRYDKFDPAIILSSISSSQISTGNPIE